MTMSMVASHARGKRAVDKIFGMAGLANEAIAKYGQQAVTNATIGAILDEQEKLVFLPTVEKVFRSLPGTEISNYAAVAGLPEFLQAAVDFAFADQRPDGYIEAVATAGGSGAIHHTIWNYSEQGDTVITADWFWGPYNILCKENLRRLETFPFFNEQNTFNLPAFAAKVREVLSRQDSLLIIINTPAHNPTGYSLTDADWDGVIATLKEAARDQSKRLILLADIAYIDYAGEKSATRRFMRKFGGLPANILTVIAFSCSKGFTLYGQRIGAMIGVSSSQEVAKEFFDVNQHSSRGTWSNLSRAAQKTVATIANDATLRRQFEKEQQEAYHMIQERANMFLREARDAGVPVCPYQAGFFVTVPAPDPDALAQKLVEENVFAVALGKGLRIATCSVPLAKVRGLAAKVQRARQAL